MQFFIRLWVLAGLAFGAYAEPQNLMLLKKEVIAYHDSGAYEKDLATVIKNAQDFLHQEAIKNQKDTSPKKLALVLDIDETSLSNYPKMVKRDFVATRQILHAETLAADAPAIKPMLALFNQAKAEGIAVFFVTGRPLNEKAATIKNLHAQGFKGWKGLYLRPDDYHAPSMVPFKAGVRKKITQDGYHILATIGDQHSDLEGGYAVKGFKLPNPYYYLP